MEGNKCEKEKGRFHGSERDENVTTLICTEQLLSVIIPLSYLHRCSAISQDPVRPEIAGSSLPGQEDHSCLPQVPDQIREI